MSHNHFFLKKAIERLEKGLATLKEDEARHFKMVVEQWGIYWKREEVLSDIIKQFDNEIKKLGGFRE